MNSDDPSSTGSRTSSTSWWPPAQWRPGTRTGYHSFTFGFLVGEIACRVTGQPVRRLLHEWVAAPLGIVGELYFGVPPTDLARLARLEDAEPHPAEPPKHDCILAPWERQPRASIGNSPDVLQADLPSVGTFTARGIVTVYAAVLDGRLIAADQLAELSALAVEGPTRSSATPHGWPWATRSAASAPRRTSRRPRSAGPAEAAATPTPTPPPARRSRSPRTASLPTSPPRNASPTS